MDRFPKVWLAKLNRAQGGTNRLEVHVKVVEFEETQKVGKTFVPDSEWWLINAL